MTMTLEESIKKRIDSPEKRARFEDAGKRIDVGLKIFELREHYGLSEEALAVILGRLSQNSESRRNRATLLVPRLRLGMHDLEAPPPL